MFRNPPEATSTINEKLHALAIFQPNKNKRRKQKVRLKSDDDIFLSKFSRHRR